jgi:hypothetical protein
MVGRQRPFCPADSDTSGVGDRRGGAIGAWRRDYCRSARLTSVSFRKDRRAPLQDIRIVPLSGAMGIDWHENRHAARP